MSESGEEKKLTNQPTGLENTYPTMPNSGAEAKRKKKSANDMWTVGKNPFYNNRSLYIMAQDTQVLQLSSTRQPISVIVPTNCIQSFLLLSVILWTSHLAVLSMDRSCETPLQSTRVKKAIYSTVLELSTQHGFVQMLIFNNKEKQ